MFSVSDFFLPPRRTQCFLWDFLLVSRLSTKLLPRKMFWSQWRLFWVYAADRRVGKYRSSVRFECQTFFEVIPRTVINRRRVRHGPCLVYELIFGNRQKASGSGVDFLTDNDYARRTNVRRRIVSSEPNTYSIPDLSS